MRNSLSFRIIASSGIWIILALVIAAILLVQSYQDHIARHFDEHVGMHLEELAEAAGFSADGVFSLSAYPSDPRFHSLHSGWYWEVFQAGKSLQRSTSLGDDSLNAELIQPTRQVATYEMVGPVQDKLRVHVLELDLDLDLANDSAPVLIMTSAPMTGITDDVSEYSSHVLRNFMALGIGLLIAVVLQVRFALKPLKAISAGISDVREGKSRKLPSVYPDDVQPLVNELNILLDHNTVLLKRARNRLGNLAHSVKNPLTVINNEANKLGVDQKNLILTQTDDISKHMNHYLSRARTFGSEKVLGFRSNVKKVVEDLIFAMRLIYKERNFKFGCLMEEDCLFRGESQDLEEMLGNLIDNACKWAHGEISISCKNHRDRLLLVIEDDGPGIDEQYLERALNRGYKLDESEPGHGLGLGIVREMTDLYGGSIKLGRSRLGGLKVELDLPAA